MEQQEDIVSDYYEGYTDTRREILKIETRKTRNTLFILAAVLLASDLIALSVAGLFTGYYVAASLLFPLIFVGLAFMANKEPLAAMIIAAVLMAGLWLYAISRVGPTGIFSGWMIKVVMITLFIVGFQHAREAQRVRKELK